ncbi:hypothetical protein DRJ17_03685 [Candidatus Woesearchaeota archaeon]|nr:MAG: hypothetical protein DRJ17_03685 [Candidatus Woesearchaeota archaeon]
MKHSLEDIVYGSQQALHRIANVYVVPVAILGVMTTKAVEAATYTGHYVDTIEPELINIFGDFGYRLIDVGVSPCVALGTIFLGYSVVKTFWRHKEHTPSIAKPLAKLALTATLLLSLSASPSFSKIRCNLNRLLGKEATVAYQVNNVCCGDNRDKIEYSNEEIIAVSNKYGISQDVARSIYQDISCSKRKRGDWDCSNY